MKIIFKYSWQFLTIFTLILVILGFFYFEASIFLRIMVVALGVVGLMTIRSTSEILTLLILYLGLYDLYNIRYGLAVPLSIIILIVFGFTLLIFLLWANFRKISHNLDKNLQRLYLVTTGLVVMEVFLTMSFWPVDPKIKSLVIVTIFYIISRVFYLYTNNMLHLKKIVTFIAISLLILGAVLAFNIFYGF